MTTQPYRLDWVRAGIWLGAIVLAILMWALVIGAGIAVWRAVTAWLLMGVV